MGSRAMRDAIYWPLLSLLVGALASTAAASSSILDNVLSDAKAAESWIIGVRRELHQIPELMWEEHNTSARIRSYLDDLDIPYKHPVAITGVVARIGKGQPIVVLRSDIDALPILEPEGLSFRSRHEGVMHACGHDAHMSMLLGAARLLKSREAQLTGTVLLVFQPAEEGGAGGSVMLREGAVEGASAAFAMHVMPYVPSGIVALRGGTIMAGALSFKLTITGKGGHAAMPHQNTDPVVAAAGLITALQTLVSRETSPLGSAVLSVTMIQGGDTYNVIPDNVVLGGTLRCLTHNQMMHTKGRIESMAHSLAAAYGCSAAVDWREGDQPYYPPTVNDEGAAAFAWAVASDLLGEDQVQLTEPIMPAEDFSFFTQAMPSAFLFLGIRNESAGSVHNLHNGKFILDESVLHKGAALHTALALEYLNNAGKFSTRTTGSKTSRKDEL